jgi:hypothetical protein
MSFFKSLARNSSGHDFSPAFSRSGNTGAHVTPDPLTLLRL